MADIFTPQTLVDYNKNPPPDDNSKTAANLASWGGILSKLTNPLSSFSQAINTAVDAAFKKTISGGPVRKISGTSYQVVVGDQGALLVAETTGNTKNVFLPDPATVNAPFVLTACNPSTDAMFFSSLGGKTINGRSEILLTNGQSTGFQTDGSNWFTFGGYPQGGTGDTMWTFGINAPTGFIVLANNTLGSLASGADFAGDIYKNLYVYLWENVGDTWAPVTGGRGSSAENDFNAAKVLTMPGMNGRAPVGIDFNQNVITPASLGGENSNEIGGTGGADTHTLTEAELAPHAHASGSNVNIVTSGSIDARREDAGGVDGETVGGGQPHNNMGPWRAVKWWIRL